MYVMNTRCIQVWVPRMHVQRALNMGTILPPAIIHLHSNALNR